jgi:tellurite resistance protein TerC
MSSVASPLVWGMFALVVVTALAIDLGIFHREARTVSMKEAAVWTTIWCALGLAFDGFVFHRYGTAKGLEFFQGWLLELSLSVDNVFVFLVIFSYFRVADEHQHRVLFWGIVGAVVARGAFIAAGVAIIERFHVAMYVLGAFLVYTAVKILVQRDEGMDPSKNLVLRIFRRLVPSTKEYHGAHFVTRVGGRLVATPLLAVLVVLDAADVVFAVDSIPAVFGVTTDLFIVLTSNIFAILGLRSLFFLVAALVQKLRFLKIGVAVILAFIGSKILLDSFYTMPVALSLGVLAGILAVTTAASLLFPQKKDSSVETPAVAPRNGSR